LDVEQGRWARNQADPQDNDEDEPTAALTKRVIPFVRDRRNALVFTPVGEVTPVFMASLQAALKSAIQVEFQLEEMELAAEPLPTFENRRHLLLFESAEGGAGVLRQIVEDPQALGRVARRALEVCHFDSETGEPLQQLGPAKDQCEAACYSCLMSYSNQRDHGQLDRSVIRDYLMSVRHAEVRVSVAPLARAEHLQQLKAQSESGLEREFLDFLETRRLRLPTHAQRRIESCRSRPDFEYSAHQTVIYVDGPHHEFPERQLRDRDQTDCMMDLGYTVIRFGLKDDWSQLVDSHPSIFGVNS
jgi:very-short-patch-repair endonuclease